MATNVITPRRADIVAGQAQTAASRGLAQLFGQLNDWLERRRHYRATVKELSALSDHLLADIGVRRHQIHAVAERLADRPGRGW